MTMPINHAAAAMSTDARDTTNRAANRAWQLTYDAMVSHASYIGNFRQPGVADVSSMINRAFWKAAS
jgi:hypothetical protein